MHRLQLSEVLLAVVLSITCWPLWQSKEGSEQSTSVDFGRIPVGGIILWHGDWNAQAMAERGYELCDGGFSPEPGPDRPDMHERFPRGKTPRGGDSEDLSLKNLKDGGSNFTRLEMTQMPRHTHPISDPGHAHDVTDPGHSHRMPMGDGDGGSRDKAADGDSRERRAVSTHAGRTGIRVNSSKTGMLVGLSGGPSESDTEGSVEPFNNQPLYQDFFYIIRVKE